MAQITAQLVKDLREMTGAGMMDCKKALSETDGVIEKAVDYLREKGLAKAAKKAGRIAAEGICETAVSADNKTAAIVEVNSETDFAAKNEKFRTYVAKVANQALNSEAKDMDTFFAEKWNDDASFTVKEALAAQIAVIGENMNIRRFEKVVATEGFVESYIHGNGRIGVLVEMSTANVNDATKEAAKNVAMQVAAMNPQYICKDEISDAELVKMRDITIESALNDPFSLPKPILQGLLDKAVSSAWNAEDVQAYNEQKNNKFLCNFLSDDAKAKLAGFAVAAKAEIGENKIFGGLVDGRISKQLKEICLLDQTYVKAEDGKQTVAAYLKSVSADLKIKKVVRFETGEGLEKKNEDFAAEVAKQMNG